MKNLFFVIVMFLSFAGIAQSSLNDYNMAIIPARFDFQKEDNQHRINSTIKAFLQQKGFEVYLSSDVLPEGFIDYNCNKLFIGVKEKSNMFTTELQVEFKDCRDKVLYITDIGKSNEKNIAKSYSEALQATLKTFYKANYKYSGKTYFDEEADEKIKSRDVENVSQEVTKVIKSEKEVTYEKVGNPAKQENNQPFIKVVNKTNQKELVLYKTSTPNVYLLNYNGRNGIVISKDNVWYFEYNDGDKTTSEKLDIKL
ncbi:MULTISPECIES: hypothetical protein [Flavobacterium]|uniref:Uncharacterized protein n=1 Tax=Flavobacterium hankyongi TaxID=1176532 RepID=A0ABP9A0N0_9FLAO|nr:hypothetical protein [Flavobacterium sp. N1846]